MGSMPDIQSEPRLARLLQEQGNASIVKWDQPAPRLIRFTVRCDRMPTGVFLPGQHVLLGLPRLHPPVREAGFENLDDIRWTHLVRRAYSVASRPGDLPEMEFLVAPVADGSLTEKLQQAGCGGRLWVDAAFRGSFTLQTVPPGADLLWVATGTGLAPFLAMLRTHAGTGRWKRLGILHGVRTSEDLALAPEIEELCARSGGRYVPVVSRQEDWPGRRGRVDALVKDGKDLTARLGWQPDPSGAHVMLCGHPDMVDDLEEFLADAGWVSGRNLHLERYWKSQPHPKSDRGDA